MPARFLDAVARRLRLGFACGFADARGCAHAGLDARTRARLCARAFGLPRALAARIARCARALVARARVWFGFSASSLHSAWFSSVFTCALTCRTQRLPAAACRLHHITFLHLPLPAVSPPQQLVHCAVLPCVTCVLYPFAPLRCWFTAVVCWVSNTTQTRFCVTWVYYAGFTAFRSPAVWIGFHTAAVHRSRLLRFYRRRYCTSAACTGFWNTAVTCGLPYRVRGRFRSAAACLILLPAPAAFTTAAAATACYNAACCVLLLPFCLWFYRSWILLLPAAFVLLVFLRAATACTCLPVPAPFFYLPVYRYRTPAAVLLLHCRLKFAARFSAVPFVRSYAPGCLDYLDTVTYHRSSPHCHSPATVLFTTACTVPAVPTLLHCAAAVRFCLRVTCCRSGFWFDSAFRSSFAFCRSHTAVLHTACRSAFTCRTCRSTTTCRLFTTCRLTAFYRLPACLPAPGLNRR